MLSLAFTLADSHSNGDASGEIVATATMSKIAIRPCTQKSDGTRVVVGVDGTAEEEPVIAPYARPEKSEAQLREYRGGVRLRLHPTDWRNGSASDSSPEGYVFESRIGH